MTDIAQIGISIDTKDVKVAQGELGKLASAADNAGEEIEQLGNEAQSAGKKVNSGLAKPAKTAGDALGGYEKNAGKAGKSTGRFGQLAGQAGFQVNDFVVQVQGGQSALLAFSQQGSQLLGAFGSIGAVAGAVLALGAAVGGVLYNQLNKGSEAAKRYKVTIDDLKESFDELTEAQLRSGGVAVRKSLKELNKEKKAIDKDVKELTKQVESLESRAASATGSGRREQRQKDLTKQLVDLRDKLAAAVTTQEGIEQDILDTQILQSKTLARIADKNGEVIDAEKMKNKMHFEYLARQRLELEQLEAVEVKKDETNDKEAKANAKRLRDLQRIIEKNLELNDLLDLRFQREFEAEKEGNDAFLQSMVNKNKTELETLAEHLQTIKDLEFSFARDGELRKQAQAAVEAQIEESITKKAEEEALKRRQLTAGYFQDASDIMSTFNDFMSLSSIGRKQTLEDELRNNKSLSAEQVKNKEAELRGIFNQEKNAKKNSILMSTAAGVMNQLATGNWAGALKVGAAGAVNYAKVNATSFKSPAPAPSSPVSAPQQTTSNITFDFSNIPNNAMITADGLVDMMKQSLRDAKLNGEVI